MNIIITGTSSGIGFGLTKFFLEKEDLVTGLSRKLNPVFKDYKNYNHLSIDLVDFEKIKSILPSKLHELQTVDLIVLNAGVLPPIKDMREVELKVFKDVMDVNLWSNKILLDIFLGHGIQVKQVVAISSGASVFGNRGWNAYSISKAALNMLVKLYAREFPDVHFSAIAPGLVDTNMQEYIASLNTDKRFPSVERLQAAKGTDTMPTPEKAAPMLASCFDKALKFESGSYLDIREM